MPLYVKLKRVAFALSIFLSTRPALSAADPLADLVTLGVHNAFELETEKLNFQQSRNNEKNAYAGLLPVFTLNANRTLTGAQQVNTTTQGIYSSWTSVPAMSVSASWTLWNNYANIRNVQLAGKARETEFESGVGGLGKYVLNLLSAYFNYQSSLMGRDILKTQLEESKRTYDQAQTLVEAGARTKLDSIDAQIQMVNDERDLMEAEINLKAAVRNLAAILNKPDLVDVPNIDLLTYRPYFMEKFDDIFTTVKKDNPYIVTSRNPDVVQAQLAMETQDLTLRQARLNYLPTTSIIATHTLTMDGLFDPSLAGGQRTTLNSDTVVLSLSWQFWDWFTTYRNINNTEMDFQKSALNLNQTKLGAATGIANLVEQYEVLEKSLQATELALKKAKEQLVYSQTMYRLGRIDLLMMQQSVKRLATAKTDLATRLASKYNLAAQILYSTGHPIHPTESEPDWLKKNL